MGVNGEQYTDETSFAGDGMEEGSGENGTGDWVRCLTLSGRWIGTKTFVFCFLNLVVLSDVSTLIVFSLFFYFPVRQILSITHATVFSSISIPHLLFNSSRKGAASSSSMGARIPFSLIRPSKTI